MAGKKCEIDCSCIKHSEEWKEGCRQRALIQAQREGSVRRSSQVKAIWAKRSPEARKTIVVNANKSTRGKKWDPEVVTRRGEAIRKSWEGISPEERLRRMQPMLRARGRKMTGIEVNIAAAFTFIGVDYEFEYTIDRYIVDFYVPTLRLVIEVDGKYWHRDIDKDKTRDATLTTLGYIVQRISEDQATNEPVKALVSALMIWGDRRGV